MKRRRCCRSRGRRWIGSGGRRGLGCIKSSLMDPDRWQRVTAVFGAALLREPAERAAFLAEACADDPSLVADVRALLAGDERAADGGTWNPAATEPRPTLP